AADDRSRVVVQLSRPVSYDVSRSGNTIRVAITADDAAPIAQAPLPAPATVPVATPPATGTTQPIDNAADNNAALPANRVTAIDFRRNANDAGRVEISLTDSGGPIDVERRGDNIVVILPETHLPSRLEKRLDVADFATPVKYVDTFRRDTNTRVVVTPFQDADFTYTTQHIGNQFVLQVKPVKPAPTAQRARPRMNVPNYSGEKISLSFQKMDIRSVLQIIAEVANVNMVV